MSKVISTTNCFLQTDFNGKVVDYKTTPASQQKSWVGNEFSKFQVNVSGATLACQAHQRIRATPMSIEFNKSWLTIVHPGNSVFFVKDRVANTLTPVEIPTGNVSCVGNGAAPGAQVINSLVNMVNTGLVNTGTPTWGTAAGLHCIVEETVTPGLFYNFIGNLKWINLPPNTEIVCIRDTNFQEGASVFNRSAHNLLGLLLNEVHFAAAVPTAVEIGNLTQGTNDATVTGGVCCGRPPVLSPLDHVYLRSRSLLPNGLSQMLNGTNLSSGLIQSDIICRIPWNEGENYALAGYGGQNFNVIGGQLPPNVASGYSGDLSQWKWKNQSGKDYSFFVPGNIIPNIEVELTTFQGTPITAFAINAFSEAAPFELRNSGMGVFITLRFDVLE